ncbi:DUF3566 domain-containing protein [Isoptericola cucumis]|uniref:DUF3566 domain-containing protein n=1 Tax=Isoptericola cucumis TaxID=1776856 RepID=A0ABQ2BBI5_9MICO|nr:DUF3566 domain-containing protein [Isoptericola cucumis]GGI10394.1 hypothetical protein GCM10007368_31020 [Isoptericola cucumis]
MSENSASTRTSGANATPVPAPPAAEPEIDDQTHRRSPVPSSSTGAAPGEPARVLGTVSAGAAASAEAPGSAGTGASPVKDGAVKAAAAALAAAKSAAKKVQSVMPDPARPQEGEAPAAPQEPRPEMHYSSGDVHPAVATGIGTAGAASGVVRDAGPRRVRLSISRVDPWSVMKLAFLLSVAIGFMTVVATMVVWYVLNDMGTFHTVQDFLQETVGPQTVNIVQFIEFDRVVSLSVLIAIVNVVLLTAIATIMAILYNITAALVGGAHLTLTDE